MLKSSRGSPREGKEGDIELLLEIGRTIKETALCGLGQSAPNPCCPTQNFRDEYEAYPGQKWPASVLRCVVLRAEHIPANVDAPIYIDLINRDVCEAYEVLRKPVPRGVRQSV